MKEVTFCIQGAVSYSSAGINQTEKLIKSIKYFYPQSPIIFSTWENENVEFANVERLVFSKDPGSGLRYKNRDERNNINRQIISTFSGLQEVKTKFVVKLRSDLLIENRQLGKILLRIPTTVESPITVFKNYVIVLDRLTFNPAKKSNLALHVTDMLQAGLTSDVYKMWELPLMTETEENFYLDASPDLSTALKGHIPEFRAEQYFWNSLLKLNLGIGLENSLSNSLQNGLQVEDVFNSNIIPFRLPTLGVSIQKEIYSWSAKDSWISSIYAHTFSDWENPQ